MVARTEREPMRVWVEPQRGPGTEPLVIAQRASPLKLKAKPLDVQNIGKICPLTVRNCSETPTGNSSVAEIGKRNYA